MYPETLVLSKIGVREQDSPLALRKFCTHTCQHGIGISSALLTGIEQEQVIQGLVHLFKVCILGGQTRQCFLAETQVVQFVLEDNARMEQAVLDKVVTLGQLLFGERNLGQIVFTVMGVLGQCVGFGILGSGKAVWSNIIDSSSQRVGLQ